MFASILSLLVLVTNAQECVYRLGGLKLDLTTIKGQRLFYSGNNGFYEYTVCEDALDCERGSMSVKDMMSYYPTGVNECLDVAFYNSSIYPFFSFQFGSFIFNYTGGKCNDPSKQTLRSTTIVYNCNIDAVRPFISDVYHYDTCNDFVQVEWEGVCQSPPPPAQKCEFKSGLIGGKSLNLSTIQGITLSYTDTNKREWTYSPCSNKFICQLPFGTVNAMSEVRDSTGQCAKILGTWSGDDIPFYHVDPFGQDYWDFFWANGEACEDGGPTEILNVRYYCSNTTNGATVLRNAGPTGAPCQFRFDVDTPLACEEKDGKPYFRHIYEREKYVKLNEN